MTHLLKRFTRMHAVRACYSLVLVLCLAGCATTARDDAAVLAPEQVTLNVESFERVWTLMRDNNWDPELGGLDWQAVHDEVLPRVESAGTQDQWRAAVMEMLGRVEQSHLSIIPASVYADLDESPANAGSTPEVANSNTHTAPHEVDGTTGIDIRVLDGAVLVTAVEPGSPAFDEGVHPGWEVLAIDGKKLKPVIEKLEETLAESTMRRLMVRRALLEKLDGPIGEFVEVRFRNEDGKRQRLTLGRIPEKGNSTNFGNLPVGNVWIESRELNPKVGYISFNYFMDPIRLMPAFEKAVKSFKDTDGLIIDLRGNPGGMAGMTMGMASWFTNESNQYLGTMKMRTTTLKFIVNRRPNAYQGRVAILIDGSSASCSEIFAGGMRDLGGARVFGVPSSGAALPAAVERLPNGDGFMYPIADYVSKNGGRFEGVGVIPDEEIPLTREALLNGIDPPLDAAVQWIQSN